VNQELLQFWGVVARISLRKRAFASWLSRLMRFAGTADRPGKAVVQGRNTDSGHTQELKRIIGVGMGKVK
jgi:hypothetical protein